MSNFKVPKQPRRTEPPDRNYHCCFMCQWYSRKTNVCCNAESIYCADFRMSYDLCKAWEPIGGQRDG